MCITAYLSLPLSPDQRSSSLAGVSVGSSSLRPPSSSSDLSRCAGMEPKLPVTVTNKTTERLIQVSKLNHNLGIAVFR